MRIFELKAEVSAEVRAEVREEQLIGLSAAVRKKKQQ